MSILCKQVENVPQHTGVGLVEFCVPAALAGHVGESLILDIEEFSQKAACGTDFACLVRVVPAFGAGIVNICAHFFSLLRVFGIEDEIALFPYYITFLKEIYINYNSPLLLY